MVSDSEPRYRLVDSNGNVVGSLFAEADGTLKLQEGTSGSDNELAFGTDGALSVDEADITNESFVHATRESDNSGIPSGEQTNILDTEQADSRGEFNSSQQFVPDETGYYDITGGAMFNNQSEGDRLRVEITNVTDNSRAAPWTIVVSATSSNIELVSFSYVVELTAGKAYEIRADDRDGSFDLFGGDPTQCFATIRRSVVHP